MIDRTRPRTARALAAAVAVSFVATLVLARAWAPAGSAVALGEPARIEEDDAFDDEFDFGAGALGDTDGAEPEVATHAA